MKEDLINCLEYLDGIGMIQTAACYNCKQLAEIFIQSLPNGEASRVSENEKQRKLCWTCKHADGWKCNHTPVCGSNLEYHEEA